MKLQLLLIFSIAFSLQDASSDQSKEEDIKRFSDALIKRFEFIPDEKAFEFWRESRDPITAGIGMMESAILNDRIGFLKRVFDEPGDYLYLIDAVKNMPASDKRDKLVIMMLRWTSPFWKSETIDVERDGSRGFELENAVEPFAGVVSNYLPTLLVNEDLFETKEKRLELASDLELAMRKETEVIDDERPKKRTENNKVLQDSNSEVDVHFPIHHPSDTENLPRPQSDFTTNGSRVVLLAFTALLGAYFFIKQKKPQK